MYWHGPKAPMPLLFNSAGLGSGSVRCMSIPPSQPRFDCSARYVLHQVIDEGRPFQLEETA